jgi:hypothetical protein
LTPTTTLGAKAGQPPDLGFFLQPGEAFFEEALSPFADNLPGRVQTVGDDIVEQTLNGRQDNLGSDDISIRRCI